MKYQTVITKHESMFPHNEYLLTLIKKNKSCLPFFSSQPYWKRSLLKMIKKNDNKSIRTTLIERIESNHEFSNEEQAVIMRFFGHNCHTISYDLFKSVIGSQQEVSQDRQKCTQRTVIRNNNLIY